MFVVLLGRTRRSWCFVNAAWTSSVRLASDSYKPPCSTQNVGVCPDAGLGMTAADNNVKLLSCSYTDGITRVEFERPLKAHDKFDWAWPVGKAQPTTWAMGPLSDGSTIETPVVLYHQINVRDTNQCRRRSGAAVFKTAPDAGHVTNRRHATCCQHDRASLRDTYLRNILRSGHHGGNICQSVADKYSVNCSSRCPACGSLD